MPNLPSLKNTPIARIFAPLTNEGAKIVACESKKISEHVQATNVLSVSKTKKKSELKSDVKELYRRGMSAKNIANLLGISVSYVYTLLNKD